MHVCVKFVHVRVKCVHERVSSVHVCQVCHVCVKCESRVCQIVIKGVSNV